jgi:protein-S-isoprenylcysteine O-methyltransferase Ste14
VDSGYHRWATRFRVPLGFALAIAYLLFSRPTRSSLIAGGAIALIGLTVRAWAAGCLDKGRSLAVGGPYAYTRNPLYLGSLLIGAGFAWAGRSWLLGLAFVALFVLVYWPVIRREESFLRQQFGQAYDRYASGVSLLFPLHRWRGGSHEGFLWGRYKKNREYEAALGYLAGIAFLILKMELR